MLYEILSVTFVTLLTILGLFYVILQRRYNYWRLRGVPHEKPLWLNGNVSGLGRTTSMRDVFRRIYGKYKGQAPFCGFYFPLRGAAIILDLELLKNVMIKDFNYFSSRGSYYNEKDDPLSAHVFNLDGEAWREMRQKLSPTFSQLKISMLFPLLLEVGERFVEVLKQEINTGKDCETGDEHAIEMKEFLARFTTDVIGSCAFGIDCNSLNNPEAEFRQMGRRVFTQRRHGRLVYSFIQSFQGLARLLRFKLTQDDIAEFFLKVVRETVEYRDKNNVKRNDFLNLLMDLRKPKGGSPGFTIEKIAAQAFVFYLAGFETSSSTMGFVLHQLAMNPSIQQRARTEVFEVLEINNGKLTEEGIKQMVYLKQVLYETMRMYSIASILARNTVNDYKVPGTNYVLEKGTTVIIPVDAIQNDPDIYPDPHVFDPDRFSPDSMANRHALTFLAFGSGPRNCIGLRFGELQSLLGLALLLKNFRFSAAKATVDPLILDKASFILSSVGGIMLDVKPVDDLEVR